jgi:hypothetical protein
MMPRQRWITTLGLCCALGLSAGCVAADVEHRTGDKAGQAPGDQAEKKFSFDLGVTQLIALISAIGALGTAAFSLVDATKVAGGGLSRVGLGDLKRAARPYHVALEEALGKDDEGKPAWEQVLSAHWMNGRPRDEQKAILKGLIRLGLSPKSAGALADPAHVDRAQLTVAAQKLERGDELETADINVLGRLDASVDAQLDAAFDRADQRYRNWSRVVAGFVAVGLSLLAAWALEEFDQWPVALLVGLLAVPFAPIAKDLVSSLQAAAATLRATKP